MAEDNNVLGLSFGGAIAIIVSWVLNGSILWAIIHMLFGWVYIVYVVIFRANEVLPAFKAFFS